MKKPRQTELISDLEDFVLGSLAKGRESQSTGADFLGIKKIQKKIKSNKRREGDKH